MNRIVPYFILFLIFFKSSWAYDLEYKYSDREHSFGENVKNISVIYGLTWFIYPVVQPQIFRGRGSFTNYKKNLGHIVFDNDEPFWNLGVHPYSGSQLFLIYRSLGYSKLNSFQMTFISSALFELTVETYSEKASVQDLYQTPVLGSIIGVGLESISLYLINSPSLSGKILGHILNPITLFTKDSHSYFIPSFENHEKNLMWKMEYSF
jgi:hypothetical protein